MPSARFFNQLAGLRPVGRPQDAAGGEVPTPTTAAVGVPCCVQQDAGPTAAEGQGRHGATAAVKLFFRPGDDAGVAALRALGPGDRIAVGARAFRLDGPAFDVAGRGAVWEAAAIETV